MFYITDTDKLNKALTTTAKKIKQALNLSSFTSIYFDLENETGFGSYCELISNPFLSNITNNGAIFSIVTSISNSEIF